MLIGDMPFDDLARRLRHDGLRLDTGAFLIHLRSDVEDLARMLWQAYAHHRAQTGPAIDHFRVAITYVPRRLPLRARGVEARVNGRQVLPPFQADFAFPMLESIFNWCIAKQVLRYVTFHAGAVERDGKALILTGPSGAGKSTLCAALSQTGWRLLSDELVMLRPNGPEVVANPRPISLKNAAIRRLGALAPQARFTRAYEGTVRGTISFLCPAREAVARAKETARPRLVIMPRYRADAAAKIRALEKANGFMALVENSVNYFSTLRTGFDALASVADACRFYELTYGDLDEALAVVNRLNDAQPTGEEAA